MGFFRRLSSFVATLVLLAYGGYFSYLNMDRVYVNIPMFGEYRVAGFLAFLFAFLLGSVFAALFFGYDFFRKSIELRRNRRSGHRTARDSQSRVNKFLEDEARAARKEPTI